MTEMLLQEETIFGHALELGSDAERAAYLDCACGANRTLRAEVEALLRADARAGDLLDLPEGPAAARPQAAELVKLRCFSGLTAEEAAPLIGLSPRTARRLWAFARAWLRRDMERSVDSPS